MWKTRLRCALNKSTDFQEVPERNQLDISEPYKVYRIQHDDVPARPAGNNRQSYTEFQFDHIKHNLTTVFFSLDLATYLDGICFLLALTFPRLFRSSQSILSQSVKWSTQ